LAATESLERAPRTRNAGGVRRVVGRIWRIYAVRRILKAILTIYLVATFTFFLVRLLPGNPVQVYINQQIQQTGMSYDQAANQAKALFSFDPHQPLIIQYLEYLKALLHGDLGTSVTSPGVKVTDVMVQYLPWTLFSVGLALAISFCLGVLLGMVMAYLRGTAVDHALSVLGSLLHSTPNYLVGIFIVVFLGIQLNMFDVSQMRGAYSPGVKPEFSADFLSDAMYHASLPIITYVLTTIGSWMLVMKSSTVETLGEDYVTVARARGLRGRRIATAYVGRNAVLPLFSQLAVAAGFVVGGSILIEQVFQYQGIGYALLKAVQYRDYSLMQGIFLAITIAVVLANLAADLLYGRLDPRIRVSGGES
jgi:peptide/nickel transport system permease protein